MSRAGGNANRSDPSRGLFWLLAFAGVSCSRGGQATECSRLAPYFLAADERIALCRQADTAAPADCARKAHAAPRLTGSHILELCAGEVSDFPGLCVAGLSRGVAKHLSPDLRVELCKGARSDVSSSCCLLLFLVAPFVFAAHYVLGVCVRVFASHLFWRQSLRSGRDMTSFCSVPRRLHTAAYFDDVPSVR